jgi:integrase/recombinase XerD
MNEPLLSPASDADAAGDPLAASPAQLASRASIDLFCDALWLEHGCRAIRSMRTGAT